jgi:hypothetical protein
MSQDLSGALWARVTKKDPCPYCGQQMVNNTKGNVKARKRTRDHIHPKSFGGELHWMNKVYACAECNEAKSDLSLLESMLREPYDPEKFGSRKPLLRPRAVVCLKTMGKLPKDWEFPLHSLLKSDILKP